MQPTTEEINASFIEIGLLRLTSNLMEFGDHIGYMLSSGSRISSDKDKCEELGEEFYTSLLISFSQIKKMKGYQLNENWYNYENIAVSNICCEKFLDSLFSMKIRALYHVLQLNMLKLKITSKKVELNKNNSTLKKVEMVNFLQCIFFQEALLADSEGYAVEFNKALGENMFGKWTSILNNFFSKNEEDIKRIRPFVPEPLVPYVM